MLLLSDADIAKALPLPDCMPDAIDALEEAERAAAFGRTKEVQRIALYYTEAGEKRRSLIVNPGIIAGVGAAVRAFAVGSLSREETARLVPRRLRGMTAVFAYDDMGMIAAIEDGYIHTIRTSAPTGVAARYLANPDAHELAIIGTGHLAMGQLAAVCGARGASWGAASGAGRLPPGAEHARSIGKITTSTQEQRAKVDSGACMSHLPSGWPSVHPVLRRA